MKNFVNYLEQINLSGQIKIVVVFQILYENAHEQRVLCGIVYILCSLLSCNAENTKVPSDMTDVIMHLKFTSMQKSCLNFYNMRFS